MGLYDEQIRQRKKEDQIAFEEALGHLSSRVLGRNLFGSGREKTALTKDAINEILKYYGKKPADIPSRLTDPAEQLEYAFAPHGIAYREVTLSGNWRREAAGPMIAYRKEDGLPVVLLPKLFGGYRRMELQEEAIVFYRPLPLGKLSEGDLFSYIRTQTGAGGVIALVLLTLLATAAGMLLPRIIKFLTGLSAEKENLSLLLGTAVFFMCALVSVQLIHLSRKIMASRLKTKTIPELEAAMMQRLLELPTPFFQKYSAGDLSNRLHAAGAVADTLMGNVLSTAILSVASLLYLIQIASLTPDLAGAAFVVLLLTILFAFAFSLYQRKLIRHRLEYEAEESGLSYSLLTGLSKIRLAGAEKRVFSRWAELYSRSAELRYHPPLFKTLGFVIPLAISLFGTVVFYVQAVRSGVTPPQYFAFSAAYGVVFGAVSLLPGLSHSAAKARSQLQLLEPILSAEPEISEQKEVVQELEGEVELSHVSFRYHDRMPYLLEDISLKIRPGEYVAVAGKTGCGKSTLLRLLLGFETPERGAVYYADKDRRKLDLPSLRRKIGTVVQDGDLFTGTVYENIAIAHPGMTEEQAWEAAELSGIAEDIREMPMGMNTIVSEGAGGISGGQKQRILIARAVAGKPKILMFDEATSALDNRTQKKVATALQELDCTRIVIAHRLSTIEHCDRILVLDQGRIAESGTYPELMAQKGLFYDLVQRQRIN